MIRRVPTIICIAITGALAGSTSAEVSNDYAWTWPLTTDASASAWQFELTPEMYAASMYLQLTDMAVFNANDQAVPLAMMPSPPAAADHAETIDLPVFAIAAAPGEKNGDVALTLERADDGSLRRVAAQIAATPPKPTTASDYVLDASAVMRDGNATIDRVWLNWPDGNDAISARVALATSDDLEHWTPIVNAAAIVDLRRDDAHLQRKDIALSIATTAKYLRLRVLDGSLPQTFSVSAHQLTRAARAQPALQWLEASGERVDAPSTRDKTVYRYRLPAALPIERVRVDPSSENSIARVEVLSSGPFAADSWFSRATFTAFRLQEHEVEILNEEMPVNVAVRADEWRIETQPPLDRAPTLALGWHPERIVFLAQGKPPFRIAVGSRSTHRTDFPVEVALGELRARLGADWQPPLAATGKREIAAGDLAYEEPPLPLPWRNWLLWSVLVIGALVVVGFALSLLRGARSGDNR